MSGLCVTIGVGAVVVIILFVVLILWLFPNDSRWSTVPGLQPSSKENGNMSDIDKAGSLHGFLFGLHKDFGPIASFWLGTQHIVSLASADLFKQHYHTSDRPGELFHMFEPIFTPFSIAYANGSDWKSRRQTYDKVFKYDNLGLYHDNMQKVANEITKKWDHAETDDQFPMGDQMLLYAIKSVLTALLGDTLQDDKEAMEFKRAFDTAWTEMEQRLADPILPEENSIRVLTFNKAMSTLGDIVARTVEERERRGRDSRDYLLIDAIIDHHPGDKESRFGDAITYFVAGFHTTGFWLTWCIYFLCMHEDVQEKVYKEIVEVVGPKDPVTHQSIGLLKYMRQVLDETLRCSVLAPWAARFSDEDMELGGHRIPAGTPVIHALGVVAMDEKVWPGPLMFDPERFSEEKKKDRPTLAFSPFGFAGHRKCPGHQFAYMNATIMLVTALQKFKFLLVPGQDVKRQYGFVTHPKEEIWVKVVKRQ